MSKYTKKVIKSYERDFSKAEECFKKDEFEIARKYFERLYSYYSKRSDISLTRLILTRLHTIYKKIEDDYLKAARAAVPAETYLG